MLWIKNNLLIFSLAMIRVGNSRVGRVNDGGRKRYMVKIVNSSAKFLHFYRTYLRLRKLGTVMG